MPSSTAVVTVVKRLPPHNLPKLRKMSQHNPVSTSGGDRAENSNKSSPLSSQQHKEGTSIDGLGCNEEISDKEDDNEEEEGECSAPFCRQPVAEQISWVQCDHCQEWFHCMCVGLTKEYAEKIDSYNCKSCRPLGVTTGIGLCHQRGTVVKTERSRLTHQVRGKSIPLPTHLSNSNTAS